MIICRLNVIIQADQIITEDMIMKIILLVLSALNFLCLTTYAQNAGGPGSFNPGDPSSYPDPVIKPSEDLDPYGNSTLGTGTGTGSRKDLSNFVKPSDNRPSNKEINAEIQKKRKETRKNINKVNTGSYSNYTPSNYSYKSSSSSSSSSKSGKKSKFFRWVDERGVIHITDNASTVPSKYKDAAE